MPQLVTSYALFDKNASWCTKQTHLAMTSPFFFFVVSTATGSSAKLDSPKKN